MKSRKIAYIVGDGVGPDIWKAAMPVFERAASLYAGDTQFQWIEVFAGKRAYEKFGKLLPDETLEEIKSCGVGIKGPIETPVGGGYRSINVLIRRELDLYACIRPVKY